MPEATKGMPPLVPEKEELASGIERRSTKRDLYQWLAGLQHSPGRRGVAEYPALSLDGQITSSLPARVQYCVQVRGQRSGVHGYCLLAAAPLSSLCKLQIIRSDHWHSAPPS